MKNSHEISLAVTPKGESWLTQDFSDSSLRLKWLYEYGISDCETDPSFDEEARLAAYICRAQLALVMFYTPDGQWVKAWWQSPQLGDLSATLLRQRWSYDDMLADGFYKPSVCMIADLPEITQKNLKLSAHTLLYTPDGVLVGSILLFNRRAATMYAAQQDMLDNVGGRIIKTLGLKRTIIGLSDANAKLGQQGMIDSLTGVANRRAYEQKLVDEVLRAQKTGEALSLLLLEIDKFAEYNQEFGVLAGDEVLYETAKLLHASLRIYDFLARYDSEKFAVILPTADLNDALVVGERLRRLVSSTDCQHGRLTLSVGAARLHTRSGAQAMVIAAENGLYKAKATGGNKVILGKLSEDEVTGSARL